MLAIILIVLIIIVILIKQYYKHHNSMNNEIIVAKLLKASEKWINKTTTTENPVNALIFSGYGIGYLRALHTLVKENDLNMLVPDFNEREDAFMKIHKKSADDIMTLCDGKIQQSN